MVKSDNITIKTVGQNKMYYQKGTPYSEYKAYAVYEPLNITLPVTVTGKVDTSVPGEYVITYRAEYKDEYNEATRHIVVIRQDQLVLNGASFNTFTQEKYDGFTSFLREFAVSELGINTVPYDDFDRFVLQPLSQIYDKFIEEKEKFHPDYFFKNYRSMEYKDLLYLAEEVFHIKYLPDFIREEDNEANRDYLFQELERSYSLDNLAKTGLKKEYESRGYSNVRVEYDKENKKIFVYGDRDEDYSINLQEVKIVDGKIKLDLLYNEEIADLKEVKVINDTFEKTIYSETQFIEDIREALSFSDYSESRARVEEVLTQYRNTVLQVDNDNKEIVVSSPLLTAGLIRDEEAEAAFRTLLQFDFKDDMDDMEFLSFLSLFLNQKAKEKIDYLSSDEVRNDVVMNYETAYDGVAQSINDVLGLTKDELIEKYGSLENIPQEEQKILFKLDLIRDDAAVVNEKLAGAAENLDDFEKAKEELERMVAELVPQENVETFVNQLNLVKASLEDILEKME